jgi:hypothetical protein
MKIAVFEVVFLMGSVSAFGAAWIYSRARKYVGELAAIIFAVWAFGAGAVIAIGIMYAMGWLP